VVARKSLRFERYVWGQDYWRMTESSRGGGGFRAVYTQVCPGCGTSFETFHDPRESAVRTAAECNAAASRSASVSAATASARLSGPQIYRTRPNVAPRRYPSLSAAA
jgi:hypothetical protein